MSNSDKKSDKQIERREFLQLLGGATALTAFKANIAKALAIPANNQTGTIRDVEHIVILMQENRPFDHHFGTLRGVRGFSDPRAVKINLPLQSGTGTIQVPVFLQPAGAGNVAAGYGVLPGTVGGPSNGAEVIPPFRVNPARIGSGQKSLGLTYFPGTNHSWTNTHLAWNQGQYDSWAIENGPMAMSYMTRDDIPYHCALADAFTVGDAYHCSVMGPTNPNRYYLFSGCIGNVNNLGSGGTDGHGAGPVTYNGLSVNGAYFVFETFPEVLQNAGVSWKFYQDLAGTPFAPDFGDPGINSFVGNFGDCTVRYSNQYFTAPTSSPLFQNAVTGTQISNTIPSVSAPASAWLAWQEQLFSEFRSDVAGGKLPQVSWIVAPAGYTEHSNWPIDYGAWYISQIFNILVSNPEVFSKTVLILNYDEADGSFDHIVPPTPPQSSAYGASTVSIQNEIVTDSIPQSMPSGPIGLGTRVPFVAISPWSKGGYVDSQVFDHTSVIQFIEKRFGVFEKNISPWRRAVAGDLTSVFNFANPNDVNVNLPSTDSYLPPTTELAGAHVNAFVPTLNDVILGVPSQEKGIRPARALPYELNVHATVNASSIVLTFLNSGKATVVFQVRSGSAADPVRDYTVEPGKNLTGMWNVVSAYHLSVYGPNGFVRYFNGSIGSTAAALDVVSSYDSNQGNDQGNDDRDNQSNDQGDDGTSIGLTITNVAANRAEITVLDAYTGKSITRFLDPKEKFEDDFSLARFFGWYDLIVTVAGDPTLKYRLAGHLENGRDSISDPALGGLVSLKG